MPLTGNRVSSLKAIQPWITVSAMLPRCSFHLSPIQAFCTSRFAAYTVSGRWQRRHSMSTVPPSFRPFRNPSLCKTHSTETYTQLVGSSLATLVSYVGQRRSQWCLSWSATFESRLKLHFSHIAPTLFTVPNGLHCASDFLPRLLRAWLYGL